MDHLSSVHDNPFVQRFGLPHHALSEEGASVPSSASSDRDDEEPQQEYHVNSGFVNKLRSKFSQLESKSTKIGLSRRSASVENLLHVGESSSRPKDERAKFGGVRRSYTDDLPVAVKGNATMRNLATVGYKPQIRPRSSELDRSMGKPPFAKKKEVESLRQSYTALTNVKPPLPNRSSIDKSKKYVRSSSNDAILKSKPEHHDWTVAPDLETFGRDDIIIIEHELQNVDKVKNKPGVFENKSNISARRGSLQESVIGRVKSAVEKERVSDENELPKPNTVSAFRNLFEKTSKTVDTLNVWRNSSPTRKSSGSDTRSPQVTSPAASPRSPLINVNDENVFENSRTVISIEQDKSYSPRDTFDARISISDGNIPTDNSSANTENVDTSSVSLQKSIEVFQRRSTDKLSGPEKWGSKIRNSKELSPDQTESVQQTLTPVNHVSQVFDSKSVSKSDRPIRSKPALPKKKNLPPDPIELIHEHKLIEKEKIEAERIRFHAPKDVVELKHEHDKVEQERKGIEQRLLGSEDSIKLEKGKPARLNLDKNEQNTGVLSEDLVKPSANKERDNLSPRQTEIFDSSKILKKNKEPPKLPSSPVNSPLTVELISQVPNSSKVKTNTLSSPIATSNISFPKEPSPVKKGNDFEAMGVSSGKPPKKDQPAGSAGMTEIKTNIKQSKTVINTPAFPKMVKTEARPQPDQRPMKPADNKEAPVSGMSSFLANRLGKSVEQSSQLKTSSSHLANGSFPSPVPKKRQAPDVPLSNGTDTNSRDSSPPPLPKTTEPPLPSTSIDDVIKRPTKSKKIQTATKMVFDSSKIATKRKEPPKRRPTRKTLEQMNKEVKQEVVSLVPKLDLSCITADPDTEYQEGYIPTEIRPCPYLFMGAGVTIGKSPLHRTKKVKGKISFSELPQTHEYEGEESALANYLIQHPEEKEDVLKQEEEVVNGVDGGQEDLLNDSPRNPDQPDTSIKANTVISHNTGALTSYKSKMQTEDFQFGMRLAEPEPVVMDNRDEEVDPGSLQLLPASESEVDAFSRELGTVTDMLF
ncbi:uncharacterized protein LOC128223665 [Mya arenaria]|uniref:uncharacterized protein LOC128223665 n=1 Tax=Mya arenaria TaxID=6604 RepID=UPI0022E67850|nr:uncharacterized protein LOC128223665 [Mya arenaria]